MQQLDTIQNEVRTDSLVKLLAMQEKGIGEINKRKYNYYSFASIISCSDGSTFGYTNRMMGVNMNGVGNIVKKVSSVVVSIYRLAANSLLHIGNFSYENACNMGRALLNVSPIPSYLNSRSEFKSWIIETIYPLSKVDGKHHFVFVSRYLEVFLAKYFFNPIKFHEKSLNNIDQIYISEIAKCLFDRNQAILGVDPGQKQFSYQTMVVRDDSINAEASLGGFMFFNAGILDQIRDSFKRDGSIKNATVRLKDGSEYEVDISSVTEEDVFAALIGHEMTHIAGRHCAQALPLEFFNLLFKDSKNIFYFIAKFFVADNSQYNEFVCDLTGAFMAKEAGKNPLGALYLQEVFFQTYDTFDASNEFAEDGVTDFFQEFHRSHPIAKNRKTALFCALRELDPALMRKCVTKTKEADACFG